MRDKSRDTDRDLLKNLDFNEEKQKEKERSRPKKKDSPSPEENHNFHKSAGNKYPPQQRENREEPRKNYQDNHNRMSKTNNFTKSHTKNLDNNHYRTIEDLYKKSPSREPQYYTKDSSNRISNYNQLNQLLNRKSQDTKDYNRNNDYYRQSRQNKYESDVAGRKPKYDITNAMNILLDKN